MKTKKGNTGKKNRSKQVFLPILIIVILTFLAGSFIYYKYQNKIYPKLPIKVKEEITVDLYFAEPNSENLIREKRNIEATGDLTGQSKQVILELIKGPDTNLSRTIPPGTSLRNLSINHDGIASVDFSPELTSRHPGGSSAELLTIYSIVNSLTLNFKGIKKVQILVEGKKVETIAGHIFAMRPFEANTSVIGK